MDRAELAHLMAEHDATELFARRLAEALGRIETRAAMARPSEWQDALIEIETLAREALASGGG